MEKPLVNKQYLLQKFPNKGGWTYAEIPEIPQDRHAHFGWVKVRGSIDGFEFKNYRLQPMGNGILFFPVKAAIRKIIRKEAGDFVTLILFKDESPLEMPDELLSCLKMEPKAYEGFLQFPEGEQKSFIDWIYAAKTDEIKHDASDPRRDDYNTCEDSMWQLKDNYKHMKPRLKG